MAEADTARSSSPQVNHMRTARGPAPSPRGSLEPLSDLTSLLVREHSRWSKRVMSKRLTISEASQLPLPLCDTPYDSFTEGLPSGNDKTITNPAPAVKNSSSAFRRFVLLCQGMSERRGISVDNEY